MYYPSHFPSVVKRTVIVVIIVNHINFHLMHRRARSNELVKTNCEASRANFSTKRSKYQWSFARAERAVKFTLGACGTPRPVS